ncbi:MAG: hypothetical protein QSU88_11230 [Candidatus Methanoperedens sp.]|nr:hypothetical protein [Candidatus Methanoperedens sp.]
MIEKTCNKRNCISTMKTQNKKHGNDIDFDQVVKFLNAQKAVMDYAGLN